MNKWLWKIFSITTILAMALALCPPAAVTAWNPSGTITGSITGVGADYLDLVVKAYPVGGEEDNAMCISDWVTWDADHYEYSIGGCDPTLNYKLVVVNRNDSYSFNEVTVNAGSFTGGGSSWVATAPNITPVSRIFGGTIFRPNGTGWAGFVVHYELNGTPGTAVADGSGFYTIPGVNDASEVYLDWQDEYYLGYDIGGDWTWYPPLRQDVKDANIGPAQGRRGIHGYIDTLDGQKSCRVGVTVTASATNAITKTFVTDADGGFHMEQLEPLNTYTVTPSKPGCVFAPTSQTIDVRFGDRREPIIFKVPGTGVYGNVKTTLGDTSLAYFLIATYTTSEGVSYSNAVNWAGGDFWIQAPPGDGTLTISRAGGPAAFGYQTAGASVPVTITDKWEMVNITLTPNRNIYGTIIGQNSTPVQRNATIDFGYGLKWSPDSPSITFQLKAQPKLYYLSPVENGILSSTPTRFLANLTAVPAVAGANFKINLKTYTLEGCLGSFFGGSANGLVLPAGSVRFRPVLLPGGVAIYPATLTKNDPYHCGYNEYYYHVTLPKGLAGSLEADNHNLRGSAIDGMNWDEWRNYNALGNREITGRVYTPNLHLEYNPGDFSGNGFLVLRDAATNAIVNTAGDFQPSQEFSLGTLEAKPYTLNVNQDALPEGYIAQPFPMSPIVTANLTAGSVDIPAASGFALVHKPIDPASATGGGYFVATGASAPGVNDASQDVFWSQPEMNRADWDDGFQGFELQVGPANMAFTDVSPALEFYPDDGYNYHTFSGLTEGQLYRWRVRAVYAYDEGPWLDTTPRPVSPTLAEGSSYESDASVGAVTFEWNPVVAPVGAGSVYSNDPSSGAGIVLNMTDTSGFIIDDYVRVSSTAGSEITTITNINADVSITVANLSINHDSSGWVEVVLNPAKIRYQVQYSNSPVFAATLAPIVTTLVPPTTGGASAVNSTVNPTVHTTYYWRVKAQYNTTGATWVDISGWSPTQMFFNRYHNLVDPVFDWNTDYGDYVFFHATHANPPASLPANTYYQVRLDNGGDEHYITFPKTASDVPSVFLNIYDNVPPDGGTPYDWCMRIVYGNDHHAAPITDCIDPDPLTTIAVP